MNRLKELREEKGISLAQLEKETGIKKSTLASYETRNVTPRTENAAILARYFSVPVPYFLGYDFSHQKIREISLKHDVFDIAPEILELERIQLEQTSSEQQQSGVWLTIDKTPHHITFDEIFKAYGFDEVETEHIVDMIQGYKETRANKKGI